jgi:CheY-like chemotaxis protein
MSDQHVLVIEDNIIHITLLTEQLEVEMGIPAQNITCAFDGIEALNEIEKNLKQH